MLDIQSLISKVSLLLIYSLELLSDNHLEPRLPANLLQVSAHAQREHPLHPAQTTGQAEKRRFSRC